MAGATNRQFKTAGMPKSTIDKVRVIAGAGVTLRAAVAVAKDHKLPVGKADAFLARHDAKRAASPEGQAATADFRSKAAATMKAAGERRAAEESARKAALQAAMTKRQNNLTRVVSKATDLALTGRLVSQMMTRQLAAQEAKKAAAPPKPAWSPKGRQNTPDNAKRMADMLHEGAAAVRAAGSPEKGMVHVYNPESKQVSTLKALSTKGAAVVVQSKVRKETHAPEQFQVVHKGTGIGIGAHYRTRTEAAEVARGVSKGLDKTIERMKAGDVRAGEALYRYSVKKRGQIMSQPSPQEKRAATRQAAKEAQAAKDKAFQEKWRASSEARDARKLRVAQRLTDMIRKAKDSMATAHRAVYDASVHVKKHGTGPLHQAEAQHAMAMARVKHLEGRAKRLGIEPTRQYRHAAELHFR
jgi:hypothetical protein